MNPIQACVPPLTYTIYCRLSMDIKEEIQINFTERLNFQNLSSSEGVHVEYYVIKLPVVLSCEWFSLCMVSPPFLLLSILLAHQFHRLLPYL